MQFTFSPTFLQQYEGLAPDIKERVGKALQKFKENPRAGSLRFHRLTDVKPPVWKIDVLPNRSWQVAMHITGDTCELIAVCSHKDMDKLF